MPHRALPFKVEGHHPPIQKFLANPPSAPLPSFCPCVHPPCALRFHRPALATRALCRTTHQEPLHTLWQYKYMSLVVCHAKFICLQYYNIIELEFIRHITVRGL